MHHNIIHQGDNLKILPDIASESVDLIYIDPPFNSGRLYETFWGDEQQTRSFDDRYGSNDAYINWLRPRVREMIRVLKPTGSFFFHCDPHANYRIRMLLQEEMGLKYQNEIIWKRNAAKGLASKRLACNHDVIFRFTKSEEFTWNKSFALQPYDLRDLDEKTLKQYSHRDADGRPYQLTSLTNPNPNRPNLTYEFMGVKRVWRWTRERMEKALSDGIIVQTKEGAVPRHKRYLDEQAGRLLGDVWDDIGPVQGASIERMGYPTQKPLELLKRIINLASNKDDVVLDAFCGCGTTIAAAQSLERRWVGIDISPLAVHVMAHRLETHNGLRRRIHFHTRTTAEDLEYLNNLKPYEFQSWVVLALEGNVGPRGADGGIDGKIHLSKGKKKGLPRYALLDSARKRDQRQGLLWQDADSIPIQVKQKGKVGRADVDTFSAAMRRESAEYGILVGFGFTKDAEVEVRRLQRSDGVVIQLVTAQELLDQRRAA